MPLFFGYWPATGQVVSRRTNDAEMAPLGLPAGLSLIDIDEGSPLANAHPDAVCVVDGVLRARVPAAITLSGTSLIADGVDAVVIAGIPAGAVLTITGATSVAPSPIPDGEVVLTSTAVGQLQIRLDCPAPYARWEGAVDAT